MRSSLIVSAFFAFLSLATLALGASQWTIVDRDFASIALSISFQTSQSGWVSGATSSMVPLLLFTDDAGKNLKNHPPFNVSEGAFLSIRMSPNGQAGVAGGLGFFGLMCGAYSTDGVNWNRSHVGKDLVCASQGASVPDQNTLVMVGTWVSEQEPAGNGVQISLDGGKTWEGQDWNFGPLAEARYANYFSGDFGFVVGGTWPETDPQTVYSSFDRTRPRKLTKNIMFDESSKTFHYVPHTPAPLDGYGDGYIGLIASAASGSSQWTLLQNFTNAGLYFNQISCSDQNNCWAACEGQDPTTGASTAWIYATTNGWSTYTIQSTFPGGSLIAISMLNSTFGWAAGGLLPSEDDATITAYVFQTIDGKTWNTLSTIPDMYIMDLSVIDQNNGYAIGINAVGLANLARYAPSS